MGCFHGDTKRSASSESLQTHSHSPDIDTAPPQICIQDTSNISTSPSNGLSVSQQSVLSAHTDASSFSAHEQSSTDIAGDSSAVHTQYFQVEPQTYTLITNTTPLSHIETQSETLAHTHTFTFCRKKSFLQEKQDSHLHRQGIFSHNTHSGDTGVCLLLPAVDICAHLGRNFFIFFIFVSSFLYRRLSR